MQNVPYLMEQREPERIRIVSAVIDQQQQSAADLLCRTIDTRAFQIRQREQDNPSLHESRLNLWQKRLMVTSLSQRELDRPNKLLPVELRALNLSHLIDGNLHHCVGIDNIRFAKF